MDGLFKLLGVLVGLYALYGVGTGSVYAKHRWSGRTIYRADDALGFWSTIVIYAALAVLLLFWF